MAAIAIEETDGRTRIRVAPVGTTAWRIANGLSIAALAFAPLASDDTVRMLASAGGLVGFVFTLAIVAGVAGERLAGRALQRELVLVATVAPPTGYRDAPVSREVEWDGTPWSASAFRVGLARQELTRGHGAVYRVLLIGDHARQVWVTREPDEARDLVHAIERGLGLERTPVERVPWGESAFTSPWIMAALAGILGLMTATIFGAIRSDDGGSVRLASAAPLALLSLGCAALGYVGLRNASRDATLAALERHAHGGSERR